MGKPTRGQIRERSTGTFELVVHLGVKDDRGRYRRVSRTHHGDEKSAAKALNLLIGDVEKGMPTVGRGFTVETMMRRWYDAEEPHWSRSHALLTKAIIDQRIVPQFGKLKPHELKPMAVERWLAGLAESGRLKGKGGLSHGYLLKVRGAFSAAYADAMRLGEVDANPISVVRVRRPQRATRAPSRKTAHTVSDLWPMVEAARHPIERDGLPAVPVRPGFAPLIHLALVTGARRGELLALRWSDLDLKAGVVSIARGLSEVGGRLVEGPPKNDASIRTVPIDPATVAALKAWKAELREHLLANGVRMTTGFRVWPHGDDATGETPWHLDTVSKWWRQLADANGLADTTFHSCRHAVATTMVAEGVDPAAVAGHLGHVDSSVTLRVYAAASPVRGREAVERLAATIAQPPRYS